MSVTLVLKARTKFQLPHRQMEVGEPLCSLAFKSLADAAFFQGQLRWSAFSLEDVELKEEGSPAPAAEAAKRGGGRTPKPKIDSVSP